MAGLLPPWLAKQLTDLSGQRVDFGNFGATLMRSVNSKKSLYTQSHMLKNLGIYASMAVGAFLADRFSKEDASMESRGLYGMAGVFVGFMVSHTLVMRWRVVKRVAVISDIDLALKNCKSVLSQLEEKANSVGCDESGVEIKARVLDFLIYAENLSKATESRPNATLTLNLRSHVLQTAEVKLKEALKLINTGQDPVAEFESTLNFWTQGNDGILNYMTNKPVKQTLVIEDMPNDIQLAAMNT